jgi:hypothetical protein
MNLLREGHSVHVFILGDADRVREQIERALLEGRLEEASQFSRNLTEAVRTLVSEVEQSLDASTIVAGGDDVCFRVPRERYNSSKLTEIARRFAAISSCKISFGVGLTIEGAYVNLRRAKAHGGDRIVDHEVAR